jgi:peroxiredoxin
MPLLESLNIPIGTPMPCFELKDTSGRAYRGADLYGSKGLLIIFTCNHCPYALAVWPRTLQLASYAKLLGIETIAINPNIHPDYPEDSPAKMSEKIKDWGIDFPYLVDEDQSVARAFKAQCTPDLYVFDGERKLYYHGRLDDQWKDEAGVTREELKEAIEQLSRGEEALAEQMPSMGCSIKWT